MDVDDGRGRLSWTKILILGCFRHIVDGVLSNLLNLIMISDSYFWGYKKKWTNKHCYWSDVLEVESTVEHVTPLIHVKGLKQLE